MRPLRWPCCWALCICCCVGSSTGRSPCAIGTVAVLTLISAPAGMSAVDFMLYNVFGGGLMLGAIFMATDYATSL